MENKIYTIREILKSKGYSMNRSWTVRTANHRLTNCKIGGKMILDFDGKFMPKDLTNVKFDEIIAELNSKANGEMWHD